MTGMSIPDTIVFIWIGFALLSGTGISLIILWGVRTRQFSDQERARRLPLESRIPPDDRNDQGDGPCTP